MRPHPDDEMFDDLHDGVEALRSIARTSSNGLSSEAVESLERLETTSPPATRMQIWKDALKGRAIKAVQKTDEVVHAHPYVSVLSALTLGILAGISICALSDSEEAEEIP